jgi:hypothetical protein
MNGYASQAYAESLAEWGVPTALPRAGGWYLRRAIAGSERVDGMGCYPLLACRDWAGLREDLEARVGDLVAFSAVIDPFGGCSEGLLRECFRDLVLPFKQHFVTDLSQPRERFLSPHHSRSVKKARAQVQVEVCATPAEWLDRWHALYGVLIGRHEIRGISAFSRASFAGQLNVPGMVAVRAVRGGATVGMILWIVQDGVAYYHLGAYSDEGYEARASFALFDHALTYFAERGLRWLNLGAGAGVGGNGSDGLTRFKSGWSTGTRTAYLCGRILNAGAYAQLVAARGLGPETRYFPAYRAGEFS